ncbi:MAG: thioesterase family protein [Pseudomonadales bacterium]|nr:thioesterase family protein [Pseudomonadales bacterium]MBO6563701.1 thioesterase family protein [Pseudomonadales bacterium]MBO6596759.1 thioesterase family protein [Pseudomonadales bacterium]MBO6656061.1 thioesterase family protein [Pseudomonadales bacterium]MBO6703428.1 thioesterase family protein [Pseudomonadales bacterium]
MNKISSADFLEMSHPVASMKWQLPVVPRTTGGRGSLFGGAGLAAGIVALEQATEKPVVWATGQYLSLTQQPVTLDLEVLLPAVGRNVIQGRAVGHLGDQEVITVFGACGERPNVAEGNWNRMPDAKSPDKCEVLVRDHEEETIHEHIEIRMAQGMFGFSGTGQPSGDNRSLLWARMHHIEHDPGALAIIADYMPSALGNALGRVMSCTSLDNTIRFANRGASEWILCENTIEFVGNGFGYGHVNMWSDTGTLLATASQSMIVREPNW